MSESKLSDFYDGDAYSGSADLLKFLLMPCVFISLFGFPYFNNEIYLNIVNFIRLLSNFAAPAFFILCGFFTLLPDRQVRHEKIKHSIKYSLIFFGILFVSYLLFNFLFLYYYKGNLSWINEVLRKRVAFDFVVFNAWPHYFPTGNSIWFIQSLLFSNLIFLIANRLKLLSSPFFYIPVLVVLALFAMSTGEFAAFFGFPHFNYNYIPNGMLNCAIPYMLIGMILRKHAGIILRIKRWIYPLLFVFGIVMAFFELFILLRIDKLAFTGNFIGLGVMAVAACCFAVSKTDMKDTFFAIHGRNYSRRLYALAQPICFTMVYVLSIFSSKAKTRTAYIIISQIANFKTVVAFVICLLIAFLIGLIKFVIAQQKAFDAE